MVKGDSQTTSDIAKTGDTTEASMTSRKQEPWENPNHPMYIHHSDQPGAILVSQALDENNYNDWSQSMNMALMIKNKQGFINGAIQVPNDEDDDRWIQWQRCDTLVKTWLLASMTKGMSAGVKRRKTARDMWSELEERFDHTNTVQLFNVESAIHEEKQRNKSVTAYYSTLKGLWDEKDALCGLQFCDCEAAKGMQAFVESQKTMKFLMGLNENFEAVRSGIVAIDPLPTVNKAYSVALRHEQQAAVVNKNAIIQPDGAAFAIRKGGKSYESGKGKMKCEKCNMDNHTTENCRSHLKCTYCGWRRHTYETCNKRKAAEQQGQAKGNHAATYTNEDDKGTSFPFTKQECKEIMEMLNKNKLGKTTMANHVGNINIPNFDEMSGPTIGDDDWDGK